MKAKSIRLSFTENHEPEITFTLDLNAGSMLSVADGRMGGKDDYSRKVGGRFG